MAHVRADFAQGLDVEFPLIDEGEIWYHGWDRPGHWAIDARGQAFADFGAHGICLRPSTVVRIISEIESNGRYWVGLRLRKLIGLKPALPNWIRAAQCAGWTPPPTFNRNEYDE